MHPNIYWSTNLRFLRHRLGWSQDELAARLGITRSKLNAHENGKTINPVAEDLVTFSGFFGISIDTLLKVDMHKLPEPKMQTLEQGNANFSESTKSRAMANTLGNHFLLNIQYCKC